MNKKQWWGKACRFVVKLLAITFILSCLFLPLNPVHAGLPNSPGGVSNESQIAGIIQEGPYYLYMPVVIKTVLPKLISPLNGAVLNTLIPFFEWDMGAQPATAMGCLAYDTLPNPADCFVVFGNGSGYNNWLSWWNFEPSTTYHWRIGVIYNNNWDEIYWSEDWSFTTAPAGGSILPAPTLTFPANGSTISKPQAILTWAALPGAVEYQIMTHEVGTTSSYLYFMSTPSLNLTSSSLLQPGGHIQWFVQARNDYAWGSISPTWDFYISQDSGSQTNQDQPGEEYIQIIQGDRPIWIIP